MADHTVEALIPLIAKLCRQLDSLGPRAPASQAAATEAL
jgi:hypothetical protein